MARVFVDRPVHATDVHFARPRRDPGLGIVDGKRVVDRILAGAREALDDVQPLAGENVLASVLRRAAEIRQRREVGRVDDERVAFEAADGVAGEPLDARRRMRPAVQIDRCARRASSRGGSRRDRRSAGSADSRCRSAAPSAARRCPTRCSARRASGSVRCRRDVARCVARWRGRRSSPCAVNAGSRPLRGSGSAKCAGARPWRSSRPARSRRRSGCRRPPGAFSSSTRDLKNAAASSGVKNSLCRRARPGVRAAYRCRSSNGLGSPVGRRLFAGRVQAAGGASPDCAVAEPDSASGAATAATAARYRIRRFINYPRVGTPDGPNATSARWPPSTS